MKNQFRYHSIIIKTYFLSTLIFIACNQHDTKNTEAKNLTADDSLKIKLIGKWGGRGEKVPVWEIRPDSIYYYAHSKAYSYKILNGDFIIDLPESKAIFEDMSVVNDTMFFIDAQAHTPIRGYRFPN
jgi:hypothetical protein